MTDPVSRQDNAPLLVKHAELFLQDRSLTTTDIRIAGTDIEAVGQITPDGTERVIDAAGALLIPGLHDHHAHLASFAASLSSVSCGPPDVTTETELCDAINMQPGNGWLRGYNYHESATPELNKQWLDTNGPARPIRIQHRSGRLWILNSLGLKWIRNAAENLPADQQVRLSTDDGRLFDVDELLSTLTRVEPLPVFRASKFLASCGVTGLNDMTPSNDAQTWHWFLDLQTSGALLQNVRLSGRPELGAVNYRSASRLSVGETKIHLHESSLPEFAELVDVISTSHRAGRQTAVHCVTEVELVFTLAAFRSAGTLPGDRIEHASVIPPALIEQLVALGLGIVTQPNFILERGDAYLQDVPPQNHPFLYRCQSLINAGIPVAFGTDMPFGSPDPWLAMQAATNRQTLTGQHLGCGERVTPTTALFAFLGCLENPHAPRLITPGAPADCCLLDVPWNRLRSDLCRTHVQSTICDGNVIFSRDDALDVD